MIIIILGKKESSLCRKSERMHNVRLLLRVLSSGCTLSMVSIGKTFIARLLFLVLEALWPVGRLVSNSRPPSRSVEGLSSCDSCHNIMSCTA